MISKKRYSNLSSAIIKHLNRHVLVSPEYCCLCFFFLCYVLCFFYAVLNFSHSTKLESENNKKLNPNPLKQSHTHTPTDNIIG